MDSLACYPTTKSSQSCFDVVGLQKKLPIKSRGSYKWHHIYKRNCQQTAEVPICGATYTKETANKQQRCEYVAPHIQEKLPTNSRGAHKWRHLYKRNFQQTAEVRISGATYTRETTNKQQRCT